MILSAGGRLIIFIQCLQCCCLEHTTMVVFVCDMVFSARGQIECTKTELSKDAKPEDTHQGATPGNRKLPHSFSSY